MRTIAAVFLVAVLLNIPSSLRARTWCIKVDGTGDAPTIQAGINLAVAGDTVLVYQGIYTGVGNKNLDFGGKDIVLRSHAGSEVTIIDCEGTGRGVCFQSGESRAALLEGMTIRNGNPSEIYQVGGGIYCINSSPTVIDCVLLDNSAEIGGGMCCWGSSSMVTGCTFSNNSAPDGGGGMYCYHSQATVIGCSFSGNSADIPEGGGGICCIDSSPTVTDCIFSGNWGGGWPGGGGMSCLGSSPTLTNCTFLANSAESGGGMYCESDQSTVTECSFSENYASIGGGMYCLHSHLTVAECHFAGNTANVGGGLACLEDESPQPSFENCIFSENSASSGGGAYFSASFAGVAHCTFSGNSSSEGSGVHCDGYVPWSPTIDNTIIAFGTQGEAVRCAGSSPSPALACCDLYGNEGGDWVGCIAGQLGINGNISEDPLFCGEINYPSDPYRLDIASPCARRNEPCPYELIGARGSGCSGPVAAQPTTWGMVKAMYK